jgi:hypothetical protein
MGLLLTSALAILSCETVPKAYHPVAKKYPVLGIASIKSCLHIVLLFLLPSIQILSSPPSNLL